VRGQGPGAARVFADRASAHRRRSADGARADPSAGGQVGCAVRPDAGGVFVREGSRSRKALLKACRAPNIKKPAKSLTWRAQMIGWGTWIRTKTNGVRVRCSTIKLSPTEAIETLRFLEKLSIRREGVSIPHRGRRGHRILLRCRQASNWKTPESSGISGQGAGLERSLCSAAHHHSLAECSNPSGQVTGPPGSGMNPRRFEGGLTLGQRFK
jgi:hypothetical protein